MTRTTLVLVVVTFRGAIDKHLQALEMAALFMLFTTLGIGQVEEVALFKRSLECFKCLRLCKEFDEGVTVTVFVKVVNPVFGFVVMVRVDTVDLIFFVDTLRASQHTNSNRMHCTHLVVSCFCVIVVCMVDVWVVNFVTVDTGIEI